MENIPTKGAHMPKVYTILLNYKGWQDTVECLESLLASDYPNNQVLVVDNNSPNDSLPQLRQWAKSYTANHSCTFAEISGQDALHRCPKADVTLIKASCNGGFAAGNNIAIRHALRLNDFDFLWLLNNDTTVAPNALSELVKAATRAQAAGNKIGIWGAKLLFYHQPGTLQAIGGRLNAYTFTTRHIAENELETAVLDTARVPQDYVVGASMFVSSAFVREVGLLNEDYFLYFEEIDWAIRARRRGFDLGYVPSCRVYHKEGKTIGSSSAGARKSILADYHGVRSKIRFVQKFYPARLPLLYALLLGSVFLRLKRLQFKRAFRVVRLMLNPKR
ncbi:glycosyltransferase family 2 protein [Pontibacter sp. CAU 1760]